MSFLKDFLGMKNILYLLYNLIKIYSGVPNSGTGTNNSTGWEKYENLIIVQDGINVIGGIYPKIK